MPSLDAHRTFITFYSYKGGVGRSLALVNVGWRLADRHGLRVLLVDWDLEAPGLQRFLGIPPEDLQGRPGLLEFFSAWTTAIDERAAEPPDLRSWPTPVTHRDFAPEHGTLALLHAGRVDDSYAERLAMLDWSALYKKRGGAAAVETLREQLATVADVVLVDSRTGLTDVGGICTAQVPDAVVMMSAYTDQSLEGIERVARAIGRQQAFRPGRGSPTLWFALGRASETEDGQHWLDQREEWFPNGVAAQLWRAREHPRGMSSWSFPQESRWALGEPLLKRADGRGPLAEAFDRFAAKIFLWHLGDAERLASSLLGLEQARDTLERADRRDDELGRCVALLQVGRAHQERGEHLAAIQAFGRSAGIAEALHEIALRNLALEGSGTTLRAAGATDEALRQLSRALEPIDQPDVVSAVWHAALHRTIASALRDLGRWQDALTALVNASEETRQAGDTVQERAVLREQIDVAVQGALDLRVLAQIASRALASEHDDDAVWIDETALLLGRAWVRRQGEAPVDVTRALSDADAVGEDVEPRLWFAIGIAYAEARLDEVAAGFLTRARDALDAIPDERWAERAHTAIENLSSPLPDGSPQSATSRHT